MRFKWETFEKTRKSIENVINKKVNEKISPATRQIAKCFVKRARARLDRFAVTKIVDGDSYARVKALKKNIFYEEKKLDDGKVHAYVRIRKDYKGLMMFLEYGTGIMGELNSHERVINDNATVGDRQRIMPYKYAVNKEKYRVLYKNNGLAGWFYTKKPRAFITKYDIPIGDENNPRSMFSVGIKPVRYIYNTQREINGLFSKGKIKLKELENKIDELEKL